MSAPRAKCGARAAGGRRLEALPLPGPGAGLRLGLGLVEVLVALGILAVAVTALVVLQAASLRATRAAQVTRQLASAAESEARLRSVLTAARGECLVATRWPAVAACAVEAGCESPACRVELHAVTVTAESGDGLTVVAARSADMPVGEVPEGAP